MNQPLERLRTRAWRSIRSSFLIRGWRLGLWTPPDRRILEEVILRYYAETRGFDRILFIGVKSYNAKHVRLFASRMYATLDPERAFARYGGKPHIVDTLQNMAKYVKEASFDVIVVNGVIGHGLDAPEDIEQALDACAHALRAGGHLVLGVNEQISRGVDLTAIAAMRWFRAVALDPVGTSRVVVATPLRERSHTFLFFARVAKGET